jgi:hypothetical protein
VIGAENIPMLGDPMEMIGRDYRQFLIERQPQHSPLRVAKFIGGKLPIVVWVLPDPEKIADFGEGPTYCTFYNLAPGSAAHFVNDSGLPIVACICQGSLIE